MRAPRHQLLRKSPILFLILGLGLTAANFGRAQDGETLQIGVTSNGNTTARQVADWPTLLQVTLSNPDAMNALLDQIAARDSKNRPVNPTGSRKVASVSIGTEAKPAATLIRFTAELNGKARHPITAHLFPAAAGEGDRGTTLDGRTALRVSFGIEPKELKAKAGDIVTLTPALAEKIPGVKGIVQKSLRLKMVSENQLDAMEKVQAQYMAGEFYALSKGYQKVAPWADLLEKTTPQLAAVLRTEMYLGLGDMVKAHDFCRQALALYEKNSKGEHEAEPPLYLFELLKRTEQIKP
jgi:hypothetical protein